MQHRQQNAAVEIVDINNDVSKRPVNLIIDLANMIYSITWLLILLNQKSPNYEDRLSNVASIIGQSMFLIIALSSLPLSLYGWYQSKRDINYKSGPVASELKKTFKLISGTQHQIARQWTLDRTTHDDAKPFHITLSRSNHELSWEIGAGTLIKQAKIVYKIIQRLDQLFKDDNEYQNLRNFYGKKIAGRIPSFLNKGINLLKNLLPHQSHHVDFPSKARVMNYWTVIAFFATTTLADVKNVKTNQFIAIYLVYSAILFLAAMSESYVLNKSKTALNLEGFTNLHRAYSEWPPTCIGQQLTQQLALYPSNYKLNEVFDYFISTRKFFEQLESAKLLDKIPEDILKEINNFKDFIRPVPAERNSFLLFNNTPVNQQNIAQASRSLSAARVNSF